MSEHEPQDASEWEDFADKKFDEIKNIIKRIEQKGNSQTVEKNVRDAARGFGDMLISLGGLVYGIGSGVSEKATGEDAVAFQKELSKKTKTARNAIAEELDKVSRFLKSETKEKKEPETSEESDIT